MEQWTPQTINIQPKPLLAFKTHSYLCGSKYIPFLSFHPSFLSSFIIIFLICHHDMIMRNPNWFIPLIWVRLLGATINFPIFNLIWFHWNCLPLYSADLTFFRQLNKFDYRKRKWNWTLSSTCLHPTLSYFPLQRLQVRPEIWAEFLQAMAPSSNFNGRNKATKRWVMHM